MSERTYPCDLWVLSPSFKPMKKTFLGERKSFSWSTTSYCFTEGNRGYAASEVYETREACIVGGRERLADQEKKIASMVDKIAARRAALDKAEAA